MSSPQFSLDAFRVALGTNLLRASAIPPEVVRALLDDYSDVIQACYEGGLTTVPLVKLLHAEAKFFRA